MLDLKVIKKKINRGEIFFISDFTEIGNYEAVRKSLQRLTKDESIKRIA